MSQDPPTNRPPDWKPLAREHARRPTGRRSILHDESPASKAWRAEFLARLEAGDTDVNVCGVMMVPVGTFYRWMAEGEDREPSEAEPVGHRGRSPYREFREDILRTRGVARSNHILSVAAAAKTDWRASAWWLARRHPEEFSEKHILENRLTNSTGSGPVIVGGSAEFVAAMRGMTPDQLRAIVSAPAVPGAVDLEPLPDDEGDEDEDE